MDKKKITSLTGLLCSFGSAAAQAPQAGNIIDQFLMDVRTMLVAIVGGIGIVMIMMQGLKWTSSADDPGARKQAKNAIIHTVIGLIIVLLAAGIVGMVT